MGRAQSEKSASLSPALILAVLGGAALLICLTCSAGGTAIYFLNTKNKSNPGENRKAAVDRQPDRPKKKLGLVRYNVVGNPTPDRRTAEIEQAIGAVPGVIPGSVTVTALTIQFHTEPGLNLIPVLDIVERRFGYRISNTMCTQVE